MVALPRLLAGILLSALLSGCAQSGDPPAPTTTGAGIVQQGEDRYWAAHPDVKLASGEDPVLARFAYDGPLNLTKAYTGTFQPQQACPFGACVLADQRARIDVSDALPRGLPLRVTAFLATADLLDRPYLYLEAPAGDRLDAGEPEPGPEGTRRVFALQRNGDGQVLLTVMRPDPSDATLAYTLTLTVEVLTRHLDARTPVAVQVPAGASAIAVQASTGGGDVRLWDPKDAFVGNRSLAKGFALFPVREAGEHVLQVSGTTAALDVHVLAPNDSAPPLLRALAFERILGEVHAALGATPVEWTFDAGPAPLGVGLVLANDEAAVLMAQAGADFQLRSPRGLLLARIQSSTCVCNYLDSAGAWGAEAPAGTYTARYTSTAAAQVQLWHFTERYVR